MKTNKLLPVLAFALMFACSGCWSLWLGGGLLVGAGATALTIVYVKGALESHVEQNPIEVANATEKAFAKLEIAKVSSRSSLLDAEIIGRTPKDERIKVSVEAAEGKGSNLSIRTGTFGDEATSRWIYDEIQRQLSVAPAGK